MKFLMICLGNICRSPLAQGILEHKIAQSEIKNKANFSVDSAGFEAYHLDETPDDRAQRTAKHHGIDISHQRQRLFTADDFDRFDKIYVMDSVNYRDVARKARHAQDMEKVDYILNEVYPHENRFVPDPYYGGQDGFEKVFQLLDRACDEIMKKYVLNPE